MEHDPDVIQLRPENCQIGTYYRTTWRRKVVPYTFVPVYLESYNPQIRKFTIVVLNDKRKLEIGPDYSLVPITEQEAQQLVDQILSHGQAAAVERKPKKQQPQPVEDNSMSEEAKADKAPTVYGVAKAALIAGEAKDAVLAKVKAQFPDADEKKVKSMLHSIGAQLKKKAS